MKALSVKQPWPWLMFYPPAEWRKDIENRNWPLPKHLLGQRVAIHASARKGWNEWREAALYITYKDLKQHVDVPRDEQVYEMAFGAIIGTVVISDDVTASNSPWFVGEHGFVLRDPILLPEPIPCKGALGFWNVHAEIEAQIRTQLEARA